MTHRLFISDLHVESPDSTTFAALRSLIERECPALDELYLLGDIVEMWIGDDDDAPLAVALATLLARAAGFCRVLLMHGNRDFLFGQSFAERCGVELIDDPHLTDDGLLLSHGDLLCTDDEPYQQARAMFRSATWQAGILAQTLESRRELGAGLRARSRAENANKPQNIMDVNGDATDALIAEHDTRVLIHGHTHRPGVHLLGNGARRYVTGAWERCAWLVRQKGSALTLECHPLEV